MAEGTQSKIDAPTPPSSEIQTNRRGFFKTVGAAAGVLITAIGLPWGGSVLMKQNEASVLKPVIPPVRSDEDTAGQVVIDVPAPKPAASEVSQPNQIIPPKS